MTRVAGPSLEQLDRLGDDYAGLVAEALATVAIWTADVEDLVVIRGDWADTVDGSLLPALGVAFEVGAATIRVGLREAVGLTASGATLQQAGALAARVLGSEAPSEAPALHLSAAAFADVAPTSDALAEAYLAQARNRLVGVGDELWSHAREELLEGLRAGESVAELAARVRKVAPGLIEPRAVQIARSEVMAAVNAGALEQVLATGATGTKEWIATDDERTRPTHDLADHAVVPLTQNFTVGGFPMSGPHDPHGPPQETISCRCSLGFDLDLASVEREPLAEPVVDGVRQPLKEATGQRRDRSFLARVFADGLAALVGWFKARTAAAMIDQTFEWPEGGDMLKHAADCMMVTTHHLTCTCGAVTESVKAIKADAGQVEHFRSRMITEGLSTGLRTFSEGALTWREPPFALRWQEREPETGGHALAVHVGNVVRAERLGSEVWGYGLLDLDSDEGLEFARKLAAGFARWVSIGLDEQPVDVEIVLPDGGDQAGGLEALPVEPEQFIFHSGRIGELTAVTVPAQAEAFIEATPALLEELRNRGVLPVEATQPLAAAVHTITIPDIPPAWWFEKPDLSELAFGAVEITDEGRLFGLLAPANVGHRGFAGRVTAPIGSTDYKQFHEPKDFGRFMNPPVLVERDGQVERIKAGSLTLAGGHAPTTSRYDWLETIKHYDESESVVARVRIGENSKGVWVAGYVLPDVTPAQLQRMMACQLSGDWRPHKEKPGWYDFAAALFVPVPGFPMAAAGAEAVPRGPTLRFQEDRLVASAVPVRHAACACPAPLAASAQPDLSRVKERIAASIKRDPRSRREAVAARVKARG